MSPIIILDNEYITVQYVPEIRSIYHTIHKPIDGQPLKDALNAGTDALKQYGACKWLSDDRKNGSAITRSTLVGDQGVGAAHGCGWLEILGHVVPMELAAAGSLAPVIEAYYELGLRMMVFTDVEKATQWLNGFEG